MDEIHEFTIENETIDLLLATVRGLIKKRATSAQSKIDLINMAEALNEAQGMRVTFNI